MVALGFSDREIMTLVEGVVRHAPLARAAWPTLPPCRPRRVGRRRSGACQSHQDF
jgi:hypothetical protein